MRCLNESIDASGVGGGTAGPESDIDLLITAPDAWLERLHWRSHVIGGAYREGRLLDGALPSNSD